MTRTLRETKKSLISINHTAKKSYPTANEHSPSGTNQLHPEVMEKGLSTPCLWLAGWSYQLCWVCKAPRMPDTLPGGSCPHHPLLALPRRRKMGHATDHGRQNIRKSRLERCFASKPCTWQGRRMEWGGANRHRTESTTLASAANTKVSRFSKRAQLWLAGVLSRSFHQNSFACRRLDF